MRGLDDEGAARKEPAVISIVDTKLALPKDYMSSSQISTYLRCPKQYEFRYIKGDMTPPGIAMVMGSAVHHAVEQIHLATIETGVPLVEDAAISAFSDKWDELSLADVFDDDDDGTLNTKDVGVSLIHRYHHDIVPNTRPIAVEQRVEYDVDGVPMVGYIDLVDSAPGLPPNTKPCECATDAAKASCKNALVCNMAAAGRVVADTKVVKRRKTQKDADTDLQLTGYAYAMEVNTVRFDSLVKSAKNPIVDQVTSQRGPQDFRWYKEVVTGVASSISKGAFPPCKPDDWCCSPKYCGYWSKCRGKRI